MTEIQYNFETPANITLLITQGATFRKRWRFRYGTTLLPFPFYSDADPGVLLWKGRCMFRAAYADAIPKVSLLSSSEPPGVTFDYVDDPATGIRSVFYGLYMTGAQTAALTGGKLSSDGKKMDFVYDIEFERLTDAWVIKPQAGKATAKLEATK